MVALCRRSLEQIPLYTSYIMLPQFQLCKNIWPCYIHLLQDILLLPRTVDMLRCAPARFCIRVFHRRRFKGVIVAINHVNSGTRDVCLTVHNFRFLKDCNNLMGRMNCMRRWRITRDNIVSLVHGIAQISLP